MSAELDFLPMILDFMRDDPMTAVYHQYSQGDYNPATSEYETIQVDTSVQAILLDIDRITSNGLSSKFNTLILQGDKELYMLPVEKANPSATPIKPDPTSDRITVAGITYKIAIVKSADQTGSNPLLYNMLLRR